MKGLSSEAMNQSDGGGVGMRRSYALDSAALHSTVYPLWA